MSIEDRRLNKERMLMKLLAFALWFMFLGHGVQHSLKYQRHPLLVLLPPSILTREALLLTLTSSRELTTLLTLEFVLSPER